MGNEPHQFTLRTALYIVTAVAIVFGLARAFGAAGVAGVLLWVWIIRTVSRARFVAARQWKSAWQEHYIALTCAWLVAAAIAFVETVGCSSGG